MNEDAILKCPVCDHVISDFENAVSDPCKHVMLTYVDILSGEFVHVGDTDEAQEIEESIISNYEYLMENDADESLDELMEAFADENDGEYTVIQMTTSGMACGPSSSTEYNLIKLK